MKTMWRRRLPVRFDSSISRLRSAVPTPRFCASGSSAMSSRRMSRSSRSAPLRSTAAADRGPPRRATVALANTNPREGKFKTGGVSECVVDDGFVVDDGARARARAHALRQEEAELAEGGVLDVVDRGQVGELAGGAEDERETIGRARLRRHLALRVGRAVAHLL